MRSIPRLGAVNAALVAVYFFLTWASDAIHVLRSPFHGFDNPAHATAASYFRALFDFNLDGLIRTAQLLAGLKLIAAVAFLAYLIDFSRALVMRRDVNRETLDWVLLLASTTLGLWAWPSISSGNPGLIRLHATQFLLLTGAMVVIAMERQVEELMPAARVERPEPMHAGAALPQAAHHQN